MTMTRQVAVRTSTTKSVATCHNDSSNTMIAIVIVVCTLLLLLRLLLIILHQDANYW